MLPVLAWSKGVWISALLVSANWVGGAQSQWNTPSSTSSAHLPHQPDGRGIAYAKSCEAELLAYSRSSINYFSAEKSTSTSFFTGTDVYESILPGTTAPYRVVTLCDGYPRVVGHPYRTEGSKVPVTDIWTNTNPTLVLPTPYPGPSPTCSIGPRDCASLLHSYSKQLGHYLASPQIGTSRPTSPPCTTPTPNMTYSSDSNGHVCSQCQILGHSIRLLYWPVTTVPDSGDLCGKPAETITPAQTASRTFLTDGITITSPSVAISISGLSRADSCGRTIKDTVIPVAPEEVTSVRGARALFSHYTFNFTDLNYKCLDDPDTIYFSDEGRDDCYQEVPADAYWNGYALWAGLGGRQPPNATIWDNYQPQVLLPTRIEAEVKSLWGQDCWFSPDGVWDPPRALQEQQSVALPTISRHFSSDPTHATPGGSSLTQVQQTSAVSTATALPDNDPQLGHYKHPSSATTWMHNPSGSSDPQPDHSAHPPIDTTWINSPSGSNDLGIWSPHETSLAGHSFFNGVPNSDSWPSVVTKSVVSGGETVVVIQSVTLTVGASQTVINNEPVGAGYDGVILGSGQGYTTITYAPGTLVDHGDTSSNTRATASDQESSQASDQPTAAVSTVPAGPTTYTMGGEILTLMKGRHGTPYLANSHTTVLLYSSVPQTTVMGSQSYVIEAAATGGLDLKGADTTLHIADGNSSISPQTFLPSSSSSGLTLVSGGPTTATTLTHGDDTGAAESGSSESQTSEQPTSGSSTSNDFGFKIFGFGLISMMYMIIV